MRLHGQRPGVQAELQTQLQAEQPKELWPVARKEPVPELQLRPEPESQPEPSGVQAPVLGVLARLAELQARAGAAVRLGRRWQAAGETERRRDSAA